MIAGVLIVAALIGWLAWLARAGLVVARMYQIEEYETPRLLAWGQQRSWLGQRGLVSGAIVCAVVGGVLLISGQASLAVGTGGLAGVAALHGWWRWLPPKKALVYTARMKRMLGGAAVLSVLAASVVGLLLSIVPGWTGVLLFTLVLSSSGLLVVWLVPGGNLIMQPVEASIQRKYVRMARARMHVLQPQVIGITGSYGKTSTKHILAQLLKDQINAFPTPKSFNTLLGVTRTINEHLQPEHKLFLVEMDAYGPGEIASMVDLVHPQLAVLTSVGPQHLERFDSIDSIGDSLYELIDGLPAGAPAVIYAGDAHSERLAHKAAANSISVVRYGFADESDQLDLIASDIKIDPQATHFTWHWPARDLQRQVSIPLLGKHNILNTTAGLAIVALLGLDLDRAIAAAAQLEAIPHRLQRLVNPGGVVVIDDSYNANPVGVHNGLDVLDQINGRQKILVTPGMVELGSVQDTENQRFGEHAATVCDHVILVGKHQTIPIQTGLQVKGFASAATHIVETLAEVQQILGQISGPGDVILFANDLPDTYLNS